MTTAGQAGSEARAGEGSDWEREEESKNSSAGSAALYWVSHDTQTELS